MKATVLVVIAIACWIVPMVVLLSEPEEPLPRHKIDHRANQVVIEANRLRAARRAKAKAENDQMRRIEDTLRHFRPPDAAPAEESEGPPPAIRIPPEKRMTGRINA